MSELNAPLKDNDYVKEFISILVENDKNTSGFNALLGYVSSMENQLNTAVNELQTMKQELNNMREERNHPLKAAAQNTVKSLEIKINETRQKLTDIKSMIIKGCQNTVSEFKQKGSIALNNITQFFKIKPALESLKNSIQSDIKAVQNSIAKIETASVEYHSAGRNIKNIGRALLGKETVQNIKPNGKLAKLIEAPFRAEQKCMENALKSVEKAIVSMDNLEKSVPQKEAAEVKPSVLDNMKKLKAKIEQDRKTAPVMDKSRLKEENAL